MASGSEDARWFLVATGRRVLVTPDVVEKVGSIHMPENAQQISSTGTIVGVGPAVQNPEIVVGIRCVFGSFDGLTCHIDGDRERLVRVLDESSVASLIYNGWKDDDFQLMRKKAAEARRSMVRAQIEDLLKMEQEMLGHEV